ncbi:BrnA antitoxin family protein [Jannaschia sp. Os4]|uniref:BrnA antitoxin family protein n=1 Tax=Jannaschia sp. Os4 TaxID=2807617 RepID=UPI00193A09C9|nr:BrnA antitoxin family protein [Jannaschia sp. Os4]MBM2575055.1 BrnA antitoxin family protein [Jannaschia sp. Os4]
MAARGTKAERRAADAMARAMLRFEWDMHHAVTRRGRVPEAWREVWQHRSAVKERVTMRVDRDVMRFFRSMGDGYGPRINTVLRAFMEARLAGMLEGEDLVESAREAWMGEPKPDAAETVVEVERAAGLMRTMTAQVEELRRLREEREARERGQWEGWQPE